MTVQSAWRQHIWQESVGADRYNPTMSVLQVLDRPALRRPILLAAFGGWGDAGASATGALSYVLGDPPPAPCATVDPEACFDFTVQRPVTRRGADGRWQLDYPEIALYAVPQPDAERDLLVLRGPEPHTSWLSIGREVATFARELGVETALTFGAFIGAVSHRRTPITRRTSNDKLDAWLASLGISDTSYSGPTAFVTALMHALDAEEIPAASLWAAGPAYLGAPNPALSLSLLETAERVLDVALELGRLQGIATDFHRKVEAALRANPEVAERLGQFIELETPEQAAEAESSARSGDGESDGDGELPSGRDLVDELERFLREQRQEGPGESGAG